MDGVVQAVVRRTSELAQVPAPTGAEGPRADLVRGWWEEDGFADVHLDDAGNVWARVRGGDGAAVVLCAHLDTVFDADTQHGVRAEDARLIGPSVGDDSVGVAALAAAARRLDPRGLPVWLLASVGEEGLGNLRGATAALGSSPSPVSAFVAVEGNYFGRVSTIGVGSIRRKVRVTGPGGHAWEAAGTPSAVHCMAATVSAIATLPLPVGTSLNVGRLGGGEGINMRAREAWFELDLRADDSEKLAALAHSVDEILAQVADPLELHQEALGDRPAGRVDPGHALVRAAVDALREVDVEARFPATSTDANAAHACGIPAVAVGVTTGSGEHTPTEWIDTEPIGDGVHVLARLVTRFEELSS